MDVDSDQLPQRLGSLVGLIYRQWRKVLNTRLKAYGVSDASWMPLLTLAKAGRPLRQKELADRLFLDTSSMVRVLLKLRTEGLVDWVPTPEDRRAKAISLTPEGLKLVSNVEGFSLALEQELLCDIPPEAVAITRQVLSQIATTVVKSVNDH